MKNYEIKYKWGEKNVKVDALSRLPIIEEDNYRSKTVNMLHLKKLPIKVKELCQQTQSDAALTGVRHYIL